MIYCTALNRLFRCFINYFSCLVFFVVLNFVLLYLIYSDNCLNELVSVAESRRRGKKTVRMPRLQVSLNAAITASERRGISQQLGCHRPVTAKLVPRSPVGFRYRGSLYQFPQRTHATARMGYSRRAGRRPLHEVTVLSLGTRD